MAGRSGCGGREQVAAKVILQLNFGTNELMLTGRSSTIQ
jgi:hypothetical protein